MTTRRTSKATADRPISPATGPRHHGGLRIRKVHGGRHSRRPARLGPGGGRRPASRRQRRQDAGRHPADRRGPLALARSGRGLDQRAHRRRAAGDHHLLGAEADLPGPDARRQRGLRPPGRQQGHHRKPAERQARSLHADHAARLADHHPRAAGARREHAWSSTSAASRPRRRPRSSSGSTCGRRLARPRSAPTTRERPPPRRSRRCGPIRRSGRPTDARAPRLGPRPVRLVPPHWFRAAAPGPQARAVVRRQCGCRFEAPRVAPRRARGTALVPSGRTGPAGACSSARPVRSLPTMRLERVPQGARPNRPNGRAPGVVGGRG